jgi:H+/Cl- antiporter ClcA
MAAPPSDPLVILRSRAYVRLLVLAALIGVPISAAAYFFLEAADELQTLIYDDLPDALGYDTAPVWWPVPVLMLSGLLVALAITRLPGFGGHSPADGFHASGPVQPAHLPGIVLAALATLGGGVVLGPEAPLILMGSGLGVLALKLVQRDAEQQTAAVVASAGSFAAISALVGSPLIGAFLLLEVAGLAGPMVGVVLVPGLLASGIGALIFLGLNSLTGLGLFSLSIPDVPSFDGLTVAMLGWAVVFGVVAPFAGEAIHRLAVWLRARIEPRMLLLMPVAGAVIGGIAIGFAEATDHEVSDVLFSGQAGLGPLVDDAASWSVGALLLLMLCKGLAYSISLSSFRGGPIFPALYIGAAAGVAASHLPGMELVPAVAMGIGAMSTVMLKLPMTSALFPTILLGSEGAEVVPVVVIAVVVAYVISIRLAPAPPADIAHSG